MKVTVKQLTQTVAPVAEPVSLALMKDHVRVDGADSDTLIGLQITAVRQWVENYLQSALVRRTYRADLWAFAEVIRLPLPPLASVTNIKYYNTDSPEVLTTLDAVTYGVNIGASYIYRASGQSWPTVAQRHDAVQVTFISGYAPDTASPVDHAANVPEAIKAAIKLEVGDIFEHREGKIVGTIQSVNPTTKDFLSGYREY